MVWESQSSATINLAACINRRKTFCWQNIDKSDSVPLLAKPTKPSETLRRSELALSMTNAHPQSGAYGVSKALYNAGSSCAPWSIRPRMTSSLAIELHRWILMAFFDLNITCATPRTWRRTVFATGHRADNVCSTPVSNRIRDFIFSSWPSGTMNDQYERCTTEAMTTTQVKNGVCFCRDVGRVISFDMSSAAWSDLAVWNSRVWAGRRHCPGVTQVVTSSTSPNPRFDRGLCSRIVVLHFESVLI